MYEALSSEIKNEQNVGKLKKNFGKHMLKIIFDLKVLCKYCK
jgi:hypothetical protein